MKDEMKKWKKCKLIKNPCLICYETVTNKTGVQCKGACQRWAHFSCLDYTPGKIQDVKSGIIQINCPCPVCETSARKEIFPQTHKCNNENCPGNNPPKCEGTATSGPYFEDFERQSNCIITPLVDTDNVDSRKKSRTHTSQNINDNSVKPDFDENKISNPKTRDEHTKNVSKPKSQPAPYIPTQKPCCDKYPCHPFCGSHEKQRSRPTAQHPRPVPQSHVAESRSQAYVSSSSTLELRNTSSDTDANALILCTLQDMCNTVGQLTFQLRELMIKTMKTK